MTRNRFSPRSEPTKSATKSYAGRPRICGRRVELREHAALVEDGDAVAELHRLLDVVGDEHDRLAHLALEAQELVLEPRARDRVDGAERLVHQQHRRVGAQGAGHADPLALAARQLRRVAVAERVGLEPDQLEQLVDPRARCAALSQPSRRGTVATFAAIVWCGNSPICWIT